jgi:subtilisin family serine protease
MRFFTTLVILFITSCSITYANECEHPVVVAVIDTGIDAKHELIKDHLWQNPSSKTPFYGWDEYLNTRNPIDYHGHGTHVAGIINQVTNCAKIMAIRYYSQYASGHVNLNNTIKALNFAIDNGAKIINYSGGGPMSSFEERSALKRAEDKGIIVVAAAGNDKHDIDFGGGYFPASYGLKNIIVVANVNNQNGLSDQSNWGVSSVDVATYGDAINSSIPGNRYGKMTGTSQATAFVSGYIVNLLSHNPIMSLDKIKYFLMKHSVKSRKLANLVRSGGVLKIDFQGRQPANEQNGIEPISF